MAYLVLMESEELTVTDRPAFRIGARVRSLRYAVRGLRAAFRSEPNAWIQAAASIVVIAAGTVVGLSRLEWCLIVGAIMAVWVAELLNTAFETLCDVASPTIHPLVEQAKDIAAGAVLITALGATVVGGLIFGPRLLAHLR
jgi:diacylglycerol kinase (ATP)